MKALGILVLTELLALVAVFGIPFYFRGSGISIAIGIAVAILILIVGAYIFTNVAIAQLKQKSDPATHSVPE